MPKRSNEFQKLVTLVKKHAAADATVTESKMLQDNMTGAMREVDICIESVVAEHLVTVSIECRGQARKSSVAWIEEAKAKHERLPTNKLILASSKGFSKEAKTVAQNYGIELINLTKIDDDAADRVFGTNALMAKDVTIIVSKVLIRLSAVDGLPAEIIVALANNDILDSAGKYLGEARELVGMLTRPDVGARKLMYEGDESHKFYDIEWTPKPERERLPLYMRKIDPPVLRRIEWMRISGSLAIKISKFPLQHGKLGEVKVAWGTGTFMGKDALLVASDHPSGIKKLSITTESIKVKRS